MEFRVRPSATAERDMLEAYLWYQERNPSYAVEWYNGILEAISSLQRFPARCALAPISSAFERKIRQLLYGKERGVYRIIFTIRDDTVIVLRVLHSSRELRLGP